MKDLLNAAVDFAAFLSPAKIDTLAERIRTTSFVDCEAALRQIVATPAATAALERLLAAGRSVGVSADTLGGILLGASFARHRALHDSSVELVWTGPTTSYVATRRTEQVLLDLVRNARCDVFLVSFVAYDVSSVIAELNAASGRGVEIRILLEAAELDGGSLSFDAIARMRASVPSALLYIWVDRPAGFTEGKVHAKVAVADGRVAFLTSANLTGHALKKNIEAGVLITGGEIPLKLRSHLHALIETRVIRQP